MKKLTVLLSFIIIISVNTFAGLKKNGPDSLRVVTEYTAICSFNECTTIYVGIAGGTPPYSYTWETGETNSPLIVCPKQITTYKVAAKDANGLSAEKEVTVQLSPQPDVQVAQVSSSCAEPCVILSAMGAINYKWTYLDTTLTGSEVKICVQKSFVVQVIGTSAAGCSDTTSKNVEFYNLPQFSITGKTVLCPGESTTLTAESADTLVQYLWLGGPVITSGESTTVTPQKSTVYTLIVTDKHGCINKDTVLVQIVTCTGITPVAYSPTSFTVYPNPFTEQFTLGFEPPQKNAKISILDMLGREVKTFQFSGKEVLLLRGNLKAGIYFIQVLTEDKSVQSKKIIVY